MVNTVIIEPDDVVSSYLKQKINRNCPGVEISAIVHSMERASSIINSIKPCLIFSEVDIAGDSVFEIFRMDPHCNFETILLSDNTDSAPMAFNYPVSGYLVKPLKEEELYNSVEIALDRIETRNRAGIADRPAEQLATLPHHKMIGIPTMEGFEFLNVAEIIRCEGRQKCTRVVTTLQTDIISSYHIGKFRTLLKGHGFFTCHKSHLINLAFVRKYSHEGFIFLKDRSAVPLARRRKAQFLNLLKLL